MNVSKQESNQLLNLAHNLAVLFEHHHLNIRQVSELLGIPMMTIRRLLTGETEDPRISTLSLIADHFQVSIDALIASDPHALCAKHAAKIHFVPKVAWEDLHQIHDVEFLNRSSEWQSIALSAQDKLSTKAFSLETRPALYPRFPAGTLFIIDPDTSPKDGDIILVKLKESEAFTLRELLIDPPEWRLSPILSESKPLLFSPDVHEIIGVNILNFLYNIRFNKHQ
jgi:transcriptional regulator with XRE-family HTH domain